MSISYVGYTPQTVKVTGQNTYSVQLASDTKLLSEVVVTALGIKREQKALSYNVQQVKSDELTQIKDANFVNSLNGKVAGVTINTSSSGVGGASRVVMRGTKSIEQSSNACLLYTSRVTFTPYILRKCIDPKVFPLISGLVTRIRRETMGRSCFSQSSSTSLPINTDVYKRQA